MFKKEIAGFIEKPLTRSSKGWEGDQNSREAA
jgi:hypothetical protein